MMASHHYDGSPTHHGDASPFVPGATCGAPHRGERQGGDEHREGRGGDRLAHDRALLKDGRQRDDKEAAECGECDRIAALAERRIPAR